MIAVIDYGAGNLRSVSRALEVLEQEAVITSDPRLVRKAQAIVLPGVGAASDTMASLQCRGLVEPLVDCVRAGTPFLGICMGLQALFSYSEEGDGQPCMGLLKGTVRRLPQGVKVPHMGWNNVYQTMDHAIWRGIPEGSLFYFVHSYYVEPVEVSMVAGTTEYAVRFPSVVARDNVVGTQFHPEKSGQLGLKFYANFVKWALR